MNSEQEYYVSLIEQIAFKCRRKPEWLEYKGK